MQILRLLSLSLCFAATAVGSIAADYTTYLTPTRGFAEITSVAALDGDASYFYVLAPAESTNLIVGVGMYEAKPGWASEETKALRYISVTSDPILDLANFFTVERIGEYIGLRNVVYDTDLFQTHDNAGYMYVNTYTDKTLDEWSYLIPSFHDGYWLFESGKYPMSSNNWACGYLGPWNKVVADNEPIALNRRNTSGDEAGHFRLFRISRNDLMAQRFYSTLLNEANGFTEVTATEELVDDPSQCYLITAAEQPSLFVGIGNYEAKPGWAGEETKALRYRQMGNPVADLSNFFTIEKEGEYIGLRNVAYNTSLFQTHDNAGFMYVLTYTEPTMSDWCYLTPTYQNGFWMFENGKYPMSSDAYYKGYLGPWNNRVEADEPIAANRTNSSGDEAGHFRLWRISRDNLFQLMQATTNADMTWKVVNPSFEQGETGWTPSGKDSNGNPEFTAREYGMSGKAGSLLMNAYQWWAESLSVSQTVTNLPAGEYELSGMVASFKDRPVTLSANASSTTGIGVNDGAGVKVKTMATVGTDGELTITVGSTTDWWTEGRTQLEHEAEGFFKIDDLQLRCNALYLDALAVRLPNNESKLVPGQWYYFETDYSTEYVLMGRLDNMVYTTDGGKRPADIVTTSAERQLVLPVGRTYFRTTATDATLVIAPYRTLEEGTFTAVALNVDGLPQKIATIELNPDGPGADGTKKISRYLASKNYDFIGCSEDFNYHGSLMSALSDNYSSGTVRKTLSVGDLPVWQTLQGNFRFDTDGLNFIWKNNFAVTNESWTRWNDMESTDGNQYVKKGYRHYDVWLGGNATIDVYVLHMDAGDTNASWSRESQWRQLSDAINASDHNRAKLIIGDTNSRYTREDIIANFIDRLSKDFTMGDVWVEFYQDGIYPTTDKANLTDQTDPTDYTKYEIVDKIIYINPTAANTVRLTPQTFCIEQDYTYGNVDGTDDTTPLGDHRPVVVTFKYTLSGEAAPTAVTLADNADNGETLNAVDGVLANVTLQGRTLHRDGTWNTICLPFDLSVEQVQQLLAPTQLMELDTSNTAPKYHPTGLDGTTLCLNFKEATSIVAGCPYMIRWEDHPGADDIVNPVFSNVVIQAGAQTSVTSKDGIVTFQGVYAPLDLSDADKSNFYIAEGNDIRWPIATEYFVNAFRAYFHINENASSVSGYRINFGDTATGIDALYGVAPLQNRDSANGDDVIINYRPRIVLRNNRKTLVK